ncbi:MAG TPA: hypothetical protein VMT34_04265, partial [Aggregatilineales bacterium]|nr:hypothetical protein [Aggregatilineales bacterium]
PVEWMPPLSFVLVLLWCEVPVKTDRWRTVYRVSAAVLTLFLVAFTLWLPIATPLTSMLTWLVGAAVVAFVGWRRRWEKLNPIAMAMLAYGCTLGLPASAWPLIWLAIALMTVLTIERPVLNLEKGKDVAALAMSKALAIVLSGAAAFLAQISPYFGIPLHPLATVSLLLGSGLLLAWMGLRRDHLMAAHAGLWLIVAAWADLYFALVPDSGTYGLCLSLFAVIMLLIERLLVSARKEKRKASHTLVETMTLWPVADLVIALSTIVLMWTALNIMTVAPPTLTVTFAIIIGIWIATGLIYRLPILLHMALWIAPIPYALLLIQIAPAFWTLPLLGVAWQVMGMVLLLLGHSAPRYRPTVLAPFFIVGYVLLGFGFTVAMGNPGLLPVSLTIIVLACLITSAAVIAGYHPVWSIFVEKIIPLEQRPFAFIHVHHLFLFLGAWLSALWLHLMLGYADLPLPRQGICLVLFASLWFVLGRLLGRLPGVVGWPVIGAGWFMWAIGLLEVFFSPTEALITIVLGLAISVEALRRTREVYWIPVLVVQILFTVLQVAWVLVLPGYRLLLITAVGVSFAGMAIERRSLKAGRTAALTGGALAIGLWWFHPDLASTALLNVLALLALLSYRHWKWLWVVHAGLFILILQARAPAGSAGLAVGTGLAAGSSLSIGVVLLVAGIAQWIVGAELIRALRPRRYRTLATALFREQDWATPFLWMGLLCGSAGLVAAVHRPLDLILIGFGLAELLAFYTARLRIVNLPNLSLAMIGLAMLGAAWWITTGSSFAEIVNGLLIGSTGLALAGIALYGLYLYALASPHLLYRLRWLVLWLRAIRFSAMGVAGASTALLFILGSTLGNLVAVDSLWKIVNGILLAIFAAVVFSNRRLLAWLWLSLGFAACSWLILIGLFGLTHPAWITLPLGAALLVVSQALDGSQRRTVDWVGSAVWLLGSFLPLDRAHLMSFASPGFDLHLICLLAYGGLAGRRGSFVGGLILLAGGLAMTILHVNVWLIPFVGGSLLLSLSLFMEARRELAERWLSRWLTVWQQWK